MLLIGMMVSVGTADAVDFTGYTLSPSFRSVQGEGVSEIQIGHPVIFNLDIHNNQLEDRSDVIIFDIRDADTGYTYFLGWQTFAIDSTGDRVMTGYWLPPEPGEYVFRAFAVQGLAPDERGILSAAFQSEILMVGNGK